MTEKKWQEKDFKDKSLLINICDQEPIHIPGSIQSFGFSLVLGANAKILYASENAPNYLLNSLESIIGMDASELFDEVDLINAALLDSNQVQYFFHRSIPNGEGYFDIAVLPPTSLGHRTIEFETSVNDQNAQYSFDFSLDELNGCSDLQSLYDTTAAIVKRQIGYDRVKLYVFDKDWNGHVIAEEKEDFMPSFKGMHFPHTDIPKQARALYVLNKVRVIADVNSDVVPLLPPAPFSQSVDLTYSGLRSVSPMHIEYLKNMKIGASFSISIIVDGALFGLVACHHSEAKTISMRTRKQMELLGRVLGMEVKQRLLEIRSKEYDLLKSNFKVIAKELKRHERFSEGIEHQFESLIQLVNADGVALISGEEVRTHGLVPDPKEILNLASHKKLSSNKKCFTTYAIHADVEELYGTTVSGMAYLPLGGTEEKKLFFFRDEFIKTVHWGGADDSQPKMITETEEGKMRVSPRKSFETFKQSVRNKSIPWKAEEWYEELRRLLAEVRLSFHQVENGPESTHVQSLILRNKELRKSISALKLEILERQGAEQRFQMALEVGEIGAWEWRVADNLVELDLRCREILDASSSVLSFEQFITLFPTDQRKHLRSLLDHSVSISNSFTTEVQLPYDEDQKSILLKGSSFESQFDDTQVVTGIVLDVSDYNGLKKDVEILHNELAQFFNTDLIGSFIADSEGNIKQCNDYFLDLLGYDRSFFESTTLNWRALTPIDQYPTDMDMIKATINGERVSYQKQFFNSEGHRIDILFGLSYHEGLNNFYGMVKNFSSEMMERNKTERIIKEQRTMLMDRHQQIQNFNKDIIAKNKELQQEILQRKKLESDSLILNKAISNSREMVLITDAAFLQDGGQPKISFVNPALRKLSGYTEEELIGQSPKIFQNENTDPKIKEQIRQALHKKQSVKTRILNVGKSGQEYIVDLSISPVFDESGEVTHFVGVQHDVTDEVMYLEALERAREQFRLVSDNLPDSIAVLFDQNLVVKFAGGGGLNEKLRENKKLCAYFDDYDGCKSIISDWLNKGTENSFITELSINGLVHDVRFQKAGQLRGHEEFIMFAQNVQNQREILRLREQASNEAMQLAKLKSQFINTASHQLKTPMSSIELNLGLLNTLMKSVDHPKLSLIVERLTNESHRLIQLMEDTLQISKISSDEFQLNIEKVDLKALVQHQIDAQLNTVAFADRNIEFAVKGDFIIDSDENILAHALQNILSNALKYSEKKVLVSLTKNKEGVINLSIQDFGRGIPKEDLETVFRQFYRSTNVSGKAGTGLGLYIVKSILDRLGYRISIASELNEGTTVTIEL
jgi:PAS domain S-box-containing protein